MIYEGKKTKEIRFPLGGIGTGSISLDGSGRLVDWEIFNRPNKGSIGDYTHFAIKAIDGEKITTYVLQSDPYESAMGAYGRGNFKGYGYGPSERQMVGFPHFRHLTFEGSFPMAHLHFADEEFPAQVTLTAFNPFIPCDEEASSLPAAFFEITVENTTDRTMRYVPAFSVGNPFALGENKTVCEGGITRIQMKHAGASPDEVGYGDLTVATDMEDTEWQTYWYRGKMMDHVVSYWKDFATCAESLQDRVYDTPAAHSRCTLAGGFALAAGESKTVRFVLSWNVPNNCNDWSGDKATEYCKHPDGTPVTWKNYYATRFADSTETASYALRHWASLSARTRRFTELLHNTTLPREVMDAASANLAVLKSPTVWRLEDGSFYGWEGVHERAGSCEGTCQHVWNYAYAMCYLFPSLERSIRDLEFRYSTAEDGRMGFRLMLPLGSRMTDFRACLDGQMGTVIKCYREWKLSGDDAWLRSHWEDIQRVLEYAWSEKNPDAWDRDRDGMLEGRQHHTLDMELFGPSSWLEGMYLGALKAASEMAEYLGDADKSELYRAVFAKGYAATKKELFNGSYFVQKVDLADRRIVDRFGAAEDYWNDERNEIKYQIADGSSIDQLLGQWHADLLGLGDLFDPQDVNTALSSMIKNNFKESVREHVNPWRIFSYGDESGSVICDYPAGAPKPVIPIPYCEETMTGFEYSFAGLLLSRGYIADGLRVIRAVRDRFDGENRNPWNEFECGSNYARSMASFAFLPILAGFSCDLPHGHLGFSPYREGDFRSLWSVDGAWGEIVFRAKERVLSVEEGGVTLSSFGIPAGDTVASLWIDGKEIAFAQRDGRLTFARCRVEKELRIVLSGKD